MKLGDFYKYATENAMRMRFARPQLADCNAAFVTNEKDEVFTCISGITIQDGNVVDVPADTSAYAMMKDAGFDVAKNICVIRLSDDELLQPSEECLEIMLALNPKNKKCMVCLGPDKEITVSASLNIVEDKPVDLTKPPEPDEFPDEPEAEEDYAEAAEPAAEEQESKQPEEAPEMEELSMESLEIPAMEELVTEPYTEAPDETEVEAAEAAEAAEEAPEAEQAEQQAEAPAMSEEAMAFMDGFDFSMPEEEETTPEDEEKALEEKRARQRAAQEAIDKKIAEKKAAEAASGVGEVKIEENNPFAATSDAVSPVEDTLAVFEDVASGKADSFKPKDEIDAKPLISPEELLKQAKRRKKVAKSNFFFRKKM